MSDAATTTAVRHARGLPHGKHVKGVDALVRERYITHNHSDNKASDTPRDVFAQRLRDARAVLVQLKRAFDAVVEGARRVQQLKSAGTPVSTSEFAAGVLRSARTANALCKRALRRLHEDVQKESFGGDAALKADMVANMERVLTVYKLLISGAVYEGRTLRQWIDSVRPRLPPKHVLAQGAQLGYVSEAQAAKRALELAERAKSNQDHAAASAHRAAANTHLQAAGDNLKVADALRAFVDESAQARKQGMLKVYMKLRSREIRLSEEQ